MPTLASANLPPTFTPVFDAGNRWAALRANVAAPDQTDARLLSSLCPEAEEASPFALPLLLRVEDPGEWLARNDDVPAACKLHLQIPATNIADGESPLFPAFAERGVPVLVESSPKIDLPECAFAVDAAQGLSGSVALLRRCPGPHLAMGVDNAVLHRECVRAGFHWFEGNWPLHAETAHAGQNATSRSTLLNLLGLVSADADSQEIEALLKRDPQLSFQLLKLVNSVSFSLTHKISSFSQAITLLGRRQLQRWLQLLLYAGHHGDGSMGPLLSIAAHRAALMEALIVARQGSRVDKDRAFMTGLFSLLDALFNAPIRDLIQPLNLEDGITRALVSRDGELGCLLDFAIAAEAAPAEKLGQCMETLAVSSDALLAAQRVAITWTTQVCREM